jgi:hypothetical protein
MTIEIMPLDCDALTYTTLVMNEDGEVLETATFGQNKYLFARRWAKRKCRVYGGEIIDHTLLVRR